MKSDTTTRPALQREEGPGGMDHESVVLSRYEAGAREAEAELCCPVEYEAQYLEFLPPEVILKDYGCGNPSAHVYEGERVLDLGSGSGKVCFIIAQKVGPEGSVVGIDFNDEMLDLARSHIPEFQEKLGYTNVAFKKGKIQDLTLDLDRVQEWLQTHPVRSVDEAQTFEAECRRLGEEAPLIPGGSIDVVVSNCVLNLVRPWDKEKLFSEIHRVLRRGGRAVISDIVCDEDPAPHITEDPDLWSGCIAGAFREDRFIEMFEQAGFYGIEIIARQAEPWRVIEGVEYRSVTLRAHKGKEGPCLERNQAVIYNGPWKSVTDDDGHTYQRGNRMAVCDKTYGILTDAEGPYSEEVLGLPPRREVSGEDAAPWNADRSTLRHPRETKGMECDVTTMDVGSPCDGSSCC